MARLRKYMIEYNSETKDENLRNYYFDLSVSILRGYIDNSSSQAEEMCLETLRGEFEDNTIDGCGVEEEMDTSIEGITIDRHIQNALEYVLMMEEEEILEGLNEIIENHIGTLVIEMYNNVLNQSCVRVKNDYDTYFEIEIPKELTVIDDLFIPLAIYISIIDIFETINLG